MARTKATSRMNGHVPKPPTLKRPKVTSKPSRHSQRSRIGKDCRKRIADMVKGLREWEAQPGKISFRSLPDHVKKYTDKVLPPAHLAQVQHVRQTCMHHIYEQYKIQLVSAHMC